MAIYDGSLSPGKTPKTLQQLKVLEVSKTGVVQPNPPHADLKKTAETLGR